MLTTLVLIDDAEYDLQISTPHILFAGWGNRRKNQAPGDYRYFTISLIPQQQTIINLSKIPLIITAPFTSRFEVQGPSELSMPLMPMLVTNQPLQYNVVFHPPQQGECDSLWDNFQDQIVIQTRLGKLVLPLYAMRDARTLDECPIESFSPRTLPDVRAPSFRLFEQIDKAYIVASSSVRPVSSSHRPSGSMLLEPMNQPSISPRTEYSTTPLPPPSNVRTPSSRPTETLNVPQSLSSHVNTELEAREVIRRLRARRATQQAIIPTTIPVVVSEPTVPESCVDTKTQAELDALNDIVKAVKVNLVLERNQAKHELEYYKMLQAPSNILEQEEPALITTCTTKLSKPRVNLLPVLAPPSTNNNVPPPSTSLPLKQRKVAMKSSESTCIKPKPIERKKVKQVELESVQAPVFLSKTVKKKKEIKSNQQEGTTHVNKIKSKIQVQEDALHDFDESDPEIDQAPIFVDDYDGCKAYDEDGYM